jgi:hypothetical protein
MATKILGRVQGLSAYEVWLNQGNTGTEEEFLNSLKGADGKDGVNGKDGTNGTNGKDGYTPVKGVDYFDGKDGTNGKDGDKGDTGEKGADGYTPVKGTDYWTEEDKEEIKGDTNNIIAEELAKRGQLKPEFVNSIEECTDTSKMYVLPDGMIYAYLYTEKEVGGYTNMVGTSKEGFLTGYRMKAMSDEPAAVTGAAASTAFVSNIFPCKKGDVLRIKGVGRSETTTASAPMFMVVPVDNDGKVITNHGFCLANPAYTGSSLFTAWKQAWDKAVPDENGMITWTYAVANDGANNADQSLSTPTTAVRLAGVALNGFDNVIVTVNEEMIEPTIIKEYVWTNTGLPFVPADYGEIESIENDLKNIKEAISYDGILNYDIFDYAYIKSGELIANELKDITGTQHGHYTGVKMSGNIKRLMCKAKIVPGSSVTLISTKLGSTYVANVTRGSVHLIFNSNGCAVGVYDGGTEPLRNLIQYPCVVTEDEEVSFGYALDENTNTMTVYLPDGTTKTLTDEGAIAVNGQYAIWEHFTNTSSHDFTCCHITKLWCEDVNGEVLDDDLKRLDGAIGTAPTGQVYTQFRTGQQINRNFN